MVATRGSARLDPLSPLGWAYWRDEMVLLALSEPPLCCEGLAVADCEADWLAEYETDWELEQEDEFWELWPEPLLSHESPLLPFFSSGDSSVSCRHAQSLRHGHWRRHALAARGYRRPPATQPITRTMGMQ